MAVREIAVVRQFSRNANRITATKEPLRSAPLDVVNQASIKFDWRNRIDGVIL